MLYSETKTYFDWAKHNFTSLMMLLIMHVFLAFILVAASLLYESTTISLILWGSYGILEMLWLIICLAFFKTNDHSKNYLQMVGESLKILPRVILLAIILISIINLLLIVILRANPLDPIGQMRFIPILIMVIVFLVSMFAYVPVLFINQNIKFFNALKASIKLAWLNKWAISLNSLLCIGYKFISIQILLPKSYINFILNDGIITALLFNYMLGLLHFNYMKHL